jgi:hypothetical protein
MTWRATLRHGQLNLQRWDRLGRRSHPWPHWERFVQARRRPPRRRERRRGWSSFRRRHGGPYLDLWRGRGRPRRLRLALERDRRRGTPRPRCPRRHLGGRCCGSRAAARCWRRRRGRAQRRGCGLSSSREPWGTERSGGCKTCGKSQAQARSCKTHGETRAHARIREHRGPGTGWGQASRLPENRGRRAPRPAWRRSCLGRSADGAERRRRPRARHRAGRAGRGLRGLPGGRRRRRLPRGNRSRSHGRRWLPRGKRSRRPPLRLRRAGRLARRPGRHQRT